MMDKKKSILNILFLILVFGLTIYGVFHGQDLSQLSDCMAQADIRYWLFGVLCVVLFILGESVIIFYMMRKAGQSVQMGHCCLYSFVGFFFSLITPSATGGQPAQIYYMKKDQIRIPVATLILMIVTITYKMVLVVLGIGVFVFRPPQVMQYLQPVMGWCYLGIALNVFCVTFMLILVFHPTLAESIVKVGVRFLGKLHLLKSQKKIIDRVERAMEQYRGVADFFRENTHVVVIAFLITVVQRVLLFYVTYLTCRSFGINGTDVVTIVLLQGMISVAVDMLPLPGGMGISESLFLKIFAPICGQLTLPAMVVSRGLAYYTQLLISALMTVVAQLTIGQKKETT
ncbi:MAG: YbhN family protein [Lachnospiraceae bacterium]